jgi:hypothetical protein
LSRTNLWAGRSSSYATMSSRCGLASISSPLTSQNSSSTEESFHRTARSTCSGWLPIVAALQSRTLCGINEKRFTCRDRPPTSGRPAVET